MQGYYDWMILQPGRMAFSVRGSHNPFSVHQCTSVLLWPADERPSLENTILTDPCFTKNGYNHASQLLSTFGLSFNDIGQIFITHDHCDHQLHFPESLISSDFPFFEHKRSLPGIDIIACPGHSPDQRALVFRSITGEKIWIVGDAILNDEWLMAWMYYWPNNYQTEEIIQTWKSMAVILSNADVIVPGHGKPLRVTYELTKKLLSTLRQYAETYKYATKVVKERKGQLNKSNDQEEPRSDIGKKPCQLQPIEHNHQLPLIIYQPKEFKVSAHQETTIFLHGKLSGNGVERPALHCGPLLHSIVNITHQPVVMPEFHELYPQVREEPVDLDPDPISRQIARTLSQINVFNDRLILIAYSYGCVLLVKLLKAGLGSNIERVVLIAPVLRSKLLNSWTSVLTEAPTLVVWGTHDNFVKNPDLLVRWFPNAVFAPIEGGNHLYYLLPSPMDRFDENPAIISRELQCELVAQEIAHFFQIEKSSESVSQITILEKRQSVETNLTDEYFSKLEAASTQYLAYDAAYLQKISL